MNQNAKYNFDGILELWKDCWRRITERRTYEWRTAYTLWAALAAFIVLVITKQPTKSLYIGPFFLITVGFLSLCLVGLHIIWLGYFYLAHEDDHDMVFEYERHLRAYLGGNLSQRIEEVLENNRTKYSGVKWNISPVRRLQIMSIAHLSVTVILWLTLVLVLYSLK